MLPLVHIVGPGEIPTQLPRKLIKGPLALSLQIFYVNLGSLVQKFLMPSFLLLQGCGMLLASRCTQDSLCLS